MDDRVYSRDHMWVKRFGSEKAVIGISDLLALEIVPTNVILPFPGQAFKQEDSAGTMEGQKLNVDIICPVSGSVSQINTYLPELKNAEGIQPIIDDPYGAGWLMVMVLSKPEELKALLTPQQYLQFTSKV
jgi:glycine cleavage system H protein